ncbi:neutral zinc metallopeptidase [Mycobacteroides abscessus]|uniref:hypothetical protein n=1 Tax=Mycobacteroides abscessus TaxID=36809 RepID=UPI00025882AA|nr:hypothetical protein [Mycobacteroides abscessus]EIC62267.1 putative metalloprotease [Mycobacteroides abscessus M94]
MSTRKRWATVIASVTVALVLSGCGATTAGTAISSTAVMTTPKAPVPTLTAQPAPTAPPVAQGTIKELVYRALHDVDAFWEQELGRTISAEVKPFDSAAGDRPTCDGDAYEVAGFCPASSGNTIRFDISEMNRIRSEGGDLAVALVMAHEYGHAVEYAVGQPSRGVTAENRADCLSGAYMRANATDYTGDWNTAITAAKPEGAEAPDQRAARIAGINAGRAMSNPAACLSYSP